MSNKVFPSKYKLALPSEKEIRLKLKATSKNVIPAKAGIHKLLTGLDSRLRGSDELGIIRGSLKSIPKLLESRR
jgi:hypothetical protein